MCRMGEAKRRRAHCAYCLAPKVSDDHVPPKNLFTADRANLITVPSCHDHNGKRSNLDERFRDYVAMRAGNHTPTTQALWDKMASGVRKNRKLQDKIRQNSSWRSDLNAFEVKIESDAFRPMIEWITRGLYWHVYRDRLPLNIEMEISEMRIGEWLPDFVSDMARWKVGGDQFYYACKRMDEHPTVSIWVYVFHHRLVAMAMTDVVLGDSIIAESQAKDEQALNPPGAP
jgi:hypothetical protein